MWQAFRKDFFFSYQNNLRLRNFEYMVPNSVNFFVVANAALRIVAPRAELVVIDLYIPMISDSIIIVVAVVTAVKFFGPRVFPIALFLKSVVFY